MQTVNALIASLLCCCFAACEGRTSRNRGTFDAIPPGKISAAELSYKSTDIALDGGSIYQTYHRVDGAEFQLWIPPKRRKGDDQKAFWIDDGGMKYNAYLSELNRAAVIRFLRAQKERHALASDIAHDIESALAILEARLSQVAWKFSSAVRVEPSSSLPTDPRHGDARGQGIESPLQRGLP